MAEAEQKKDIYYPFRQNLFQKPKYKNYKFKNRGIARGLKTRKGFPTTKIGKYAGTFRTSGHKNPRLMNKAMSRLKLKTHEKRVNYYYYYYYYFVYNKQYETNNINMFLFEIISKNSQDQVVNLLCLLFVKLLDGHHMKNV